MHIEMTSSILHASLAVDARVLTVWIDLVEIGCSN